MSDDDPTADDTLPQPPQTRGRSDSKASTGSLHSLHSTDGLLTSGSQDLTSSLSFRPGLIKSSRTVLLWLVLNLGFNFYNKWVFASLGFTFPVALIALNLLVTSFVCLLVLYSCSHSRSHANTVHADKAVLHSHWKMLVLLSALHGFDLVFENASLVRVSLSLNQIVKSTMPFFQMIVARLFEGKHFSARMYLSSVIIVLGCILTVFRNPDFDTIGFLCAVLSMLLAVAKTLVSALLLENTQLSLLSITLTTALPASLMLIPVFTSLEADAFWAYTAANASVTLFVLLTSSIFAVVYTWVHFLLIKDTSSVTSVILGGAKVILLVYISIPLFHTQLTLINWIGTLVAVAAFLWYSNLKFEQLKEKKRMETIRFLLDGKLGSHVDADPEDGHSDNADRDQDGLDSEDDDNARVPRAHSTHKHSPASPLTRLFGGNPPGSGSTRRWSLFGNPGVSGTGKHVKYSRVSTDEDEELHNLTADDDDDDLEADIEDEPYLLDADVDNMFPELSQLPDDTAARRLDF